jgi:hypothetical protein
VRPESRKLALQVILYNVLFRYRRTDQFSCLRISIKCTPFRRAIPVAEGLAVTLRSLASCNLFTSLNFLFKKSKQSVSTFIHFLFHSCCIDAKFCRNFPPRVIFLYSQVYKTYVCCPTKPHVFLTR